MHHPSLSERFPDGKRPLGGELAPLGELRNEDQVQIAERTIRELCRIGISVPETSRLPQAKRDLEAAGSVELVLGDTRGEDRIAEARRTVFELSAIVRTLGYRVSSIRKQFDDLVGGPFEPRTDGGYDRARDVQSELLVAAALEAGSYDLVFAEPDLIVSNLLGKRFGVAVKRVSSQRVDQFEKHLRKGRDQLKRNGVPGIIVMNAERWLHALYRRDNCTDVSKELYVRVTEWLDYIHEKDPELHVRAVIGMATSIRFVEGAFDCRLHFNPRFLVAEGETQKLAEEVEGMIAKMCVGLRGLFSP